MKPDSRAAGEVIIATTPNMVRALGARDAIVMQQLVYWRAAGVEVTRSTLATLTGLSAKQIVAAVTKLEGRGLVVSEAPGGYDRTMVYEVDWDVWDELAICPNGQMHLPKRSTPFAQTGISTTPIDTKDRENARALFELEFEPIWKRYPRRLARKAALNAFIARRRDGVDAESMGRAVDGYRLCCEHEARMDRHIMYGATFFGPNERWQEFDGWRAPVVASSRLEGNLAAIEASR